MIRGTVQSVLFQNPENGYSVLKLRTEEGELVTVVGTIPMTIVGERLVIAGGDILVPFLPRGQGHRRKDGGEDRLLFRRVEPGCVGE